MEENEDDIYGNTDEKVKNNAIWDRTTTVNDTKYLPVEKNKSTVGDVSGYDPAHFTYVKKDIPDMTNHFAQVFDATYKKPQEDTEDADRLRRVAKMQALGDLFKHLGNFAGQGYAPVERRQDNARLYQTLARSDAERARIKALAEQHRRDRQSYIERMNKAYRDEALQQQKMEQEANSKTIQAINDAEKFRAGQKNKYLPTQETTKYGSFENKKDSATSYNPEGHTAGKAKANNEVHFLASDNNTRYVMSKPAASSMLQILKKGGYLKTPETGRLITLIGQEAWINDPTEWQDAMRQFYEKAQRDPTVYQMWMDAVHNNTGIKKEPITEGKMTEPTLAAPVQLLQKFLNRNRDNRDARDIEDETTSNSGSVPNTNFIF
jgi:hypothetical protein